VGEHASHGHSRVIRIDADVYARLQKLAAGFEMPNSVLRRVLGLDQDENTGVPEESAGRRFCAVCEQERVTTNQHVRFEDQAESIIDVCGDCLAEGLADRTVVLINDRRN